MIVTLTPQSNVLPHYKNIIDIQSNNTIINSINECYPILAGGYPMSLLLAPRKWTDKLQIKAGYYSDYDIYFQDESNYERAQAIIDAEYHNDIENKISTENAISYKIGIEDPILGGPTQVQLIKKVTNTPKKILETFDFVNCAIGYTPSDNKFYFHKDLFKYHNTRELEILKPWMLDDVNQDTLNNVIIQVARFKKYCLRWEYTLASKAFWKLIKVYQQFPNLRVERNILQSGGSYNNVMFIATANQNIWEAIAPVMTSHLEWKDYKDPHGILNGSQEELNQNPFLVQETQF